MRTRSLWGLYSWKPVIVPPWDEKLYCPSSGTQDVRTTEVVRGSAAPSRFISRTCGLIKAAGPHSGAVAGHLFFNLWTCFFRTLTSPTSAAAGMTAWPSALCCTPTCLLTSHTRNSPARRRQVEAQLSIYNPEMNDYSWRYVQNDDLP